MFIHWMLNVFYVFNLLDSIFLSSFYPNRWRKSKMFSIYKKGSRNQCSNYSGISVLDSLGKLYNKVSKNKQISD